MNSKSEDLGLVSFATLLWYECWIYLEENVVEGSTKVGTIDLSMSGGFGVVDVFTSSTEEFD